MNIHWMSYRLFSWVASVFVALWWLIRMVRFPVYRSRWQERFGWVSMPKEMSSQPIWVHAVSVGEVITSAPLVHKIRAQYPDVPIVVTTMTPTGAEQAKKRMPEDIILRYMPFDLTGAVARYITRINPRILLLIETELWPNWLWHLQAKKVPVLLCNARLSQRSYAGYARLACWVGDALRSLAWVAAQTEDDAKRFAQLGLKPEQISVLGNLKYDVRLGEAAHQGAKKWRDYLAGYDWVLAASTHPGEEALCLEAFLTLRAQKPSARLCLAPRHPHRADEILALCQAKGLSVVARSSVDFTIPWDEKTDVLLVDTLGELGMFYGACPVAFVGGSLIEQGGHNPIEPSEMGCAVITGPHIFNFSEVYGLLQAKDACYFIQDPASLAKAWQQAMLDGDKKAKLAWQVVEQSLGATERHLKGIAGFLDQ